MNKTRMSLKYYAEQHYPVDMQRNPLSTIRRLQKQCEPGGLLSHVAVKEGKKWMIEEKPESASSNPLVA